MSQPLSLMPCRLVRLMFMSLMLGLLAILTLSCAKNTPKPSALASKPLAPLPIGTKPIAPTKQKIPSFFHNAASPLKPLVGDSRDFVALLNQGAGVVAVWGSAPASWVWVHSAALNARFGDAFNWAMQPVGNGLFRFVNKLTRTCLNAYGQGVIHYPCDPNNPNQFFRILPMDNGASAIQSASTNLCLQTSMHTKANHPITLNKCLQVANSEQQWFIIPPFLKPMPIIYP